MINKIIKKLPIGSYKIFFDLIFDNKKNFIFLIFLFLLQIAILSLAIIAIIPLADFIVDQNLSSPNKITKFILYWMDIFEIKKSLMFFLFLFLLISVLKSLTDIIITKQIYKIRYKIETNLFKNFSTKVLETEWNFFFKYPSGTLLNIYTYVINQICAGFTAIASQVTMIIKLLAYLIVPTAINYKISKTFKIMILTKNSSNKNSFQNHQFIAGNA